MLQSLDSLGGVALLVMQQTSDFSRFFSSSKHLRGKNMDRGDVDRNVARGRVVWQRRTFRGSTRRAPFIAEME